MQLKGRSGLTFPIQSIPPPRSVFIFMACVKAERISIFRLHVSSIPNTVDHRHYGPHIPPASAHVYKHTPAGARPSGRELQQANL